MSTLTRAFTKRHKRPEVSAPMPYREEKAKGHSRFNSGSIKRSNISGPVQLISTTNMLAYNAPDLGSIAQSPVSSSSSSSMRSRGNSDVAVSPHSYSSAITTPDVSQNTSPIDGSPTSYFPKRSATVTSAPRSSTTSTSSTEAPVVPTRALSHTKRSHQDLARKRSQSGMSPPTLSAPRSNPTLGASLEMFKATPESHPFSKELAQVNEVAEEFGGPHVLDEDELYLTRKGLHKFTVDDYLAEIEELYGSVFDNKLGPISAGPWL
ncbi:hypothetical protein N7520_008236 [Penicillium odoratum]|uniref:uncharacterized protein n=1 Tax=Penicillium odoratum TaxID=1167516 RepID=UPI0025473F9A|nr:uncharacterized protein N7520_008236 [Penicillium odoratum]KAJ5761080.1 hypothetical protein N7520_008236 [Penicillium odoratum]